MNLRSGRTLRRDSRNYDEFNERRIYQLQQQNIEDSIYEEEETPQSKLKKKIDNVFHKASHLLYLIKCQNENKHSLSDRINTIMEIYEVFRYNLDNLVEYFKDRDEKRLPQAIFNKGPELVNEIARLVRTRKEKKLYEKCRKDIGYVMYLLEYYILNKN